MKRKQVISVSIDPDLLQSLDDLVAEREFRNISNAICELTLGGIKLHQYRELAKDPAKAAEFHAAMNARIHNETFQEWLAPLLPQQLEGIRDMCDMMMGNQ